MGCGGSKDVANSKAPAASDPKVVVVKDNPVSKLSRPSSLAAVDESKTENALEAPPPISTPEVSPEPEYAAVSDVIIEDAEGQNPETANKDGFTSAPVMIDTALSSGTNDEHNAERSISMAISSTDTNNNTAEGITIDIPPHPSTDHSELQWSLSLTPVSRAASINHMEVPEGEDTPSLIGERLLEQQQSTAIALLTAPDDLLSSPKAGREDLRTPNGVHSLQHADTGESCFGFQQLNLMELNQVSAVELTYDEAHDSNSNSQQQSPQHDVTRTLSGFHNPRVDAMSRQSSVAVPIPPSTQSPVQALPHVSLA